LGFWSVSKNMNLYEKIRFRLSTFSYQLFQCKTFEIDFYANKLYFRVKLWFRSRESKSTFSFRNKIGRKIFKMSKSRNSSRNSGRESSRSNRSHRSRSTSRTPSAASRSNSRSPSRANEELTRELDDAGERLNSTFWQTFPIHNFKTNKAEITNNSTVPLSSYNQSKVRNILLKHFSFIWIQNLRNSWGWN
jgi:hypothetical protein